MSNQQERRAQQDAQGPIAILLDPTASEEMKDNAREQLDKLQGSPNTAREFPGDAASDKPGTYDGQDASRDVVNTVFFGIVKAMAREERVAYYVGIDERFGAKLLFSIILDIDDDEREHAVKLSLFSID
ncbi:hypothetical protein EIP86_000538 [Pleurotus ostreatoroseus]|nr:hypothetical protein EIP86_000538 [Pleurotus ostreatoroseus]